MEQLGHLGAKRKEYFRDQQIPWETKQRKVNHRDGEKNLDLISQFVRSYEICVVISRALELCKTKFKKSKTLAKKKKLM